jgi:hypothetical protein
MPEYETADWRQQAGSAEALRHGHYRVADDDAELTHERLEALEPRINAIRSSQEPAFDASAMDLPGTVIRDMLLMKYTVTQARLGVPVYSSVGWYRASENQETRKQLLLGDRDMHRFI